MPLKAGKISTVILWICMSISLILFGILLWDSFLNEEENVLQDTGWLLLWIYAMVGLIIICSIFFICRNIIDIFKKKPKAILRSSLPVLMLCLMFITTYLLGNGTRLNIAQYLGTENTFFWLKMTDMWIYSIYILLGLTIIVILGGIIWSFFKTKH